MSMLRRRLLSPGSLFSLAALGLLGFGLVNGFFDPAETIATQVPGAPQPMADAAPPPASGHPLDEATSRSASI